MTREEIVTHWMHIAHSVFSAEHKIISDWKSKFEEAIVNKSKAVEVQKAYLRAIAEEIISQTSEEELQKLYKLKPLL